MIGIVAARNGPDDMVDAQEKLEMQLLRQLEGFEDALVEERGPPLVHDLRLDLGDEVLSLLVDDGEEVLLPLLEERIVVADEEQQVLVGRGWDLAEVGLDELLAAVDALEGVHPRRRHRDEAVALLVLCEILGGGVRA